MEGVAVKLEDRDSQKLYTYVHNYILHRLLITAVHRCHFVGFARAPIAIAWYCTYITRLNNALVKLLCAGSFAWYI